MWGGWGVCVGGQRCAVLSSEKLHHSARFESNIVIIFGHSPRISPKNPIRIRSLLPICTVGDGASCSEALATPLNET